MRDMRVRTRELWMHAGQFRDTEQAIAAVEAVLGGERAPAE